MKKLAILILIIITFLSGCTRMKQDKKIENIGIIYNDFESINIFEDNKVSIIKDKESINTNSNPLLKDINFIFDEYKNISSLELNQFSIHVQTLENIHVGSDRKSFYNQLGDLLPENLKEEGLYVYSFILNKNIDETVEIYFLNNEQVIPTSNSDNVYYKMTITFDDFFGGRIERITFLRL